MGGFIFNLIRNYVGRFHVLNIIPTNVVAARDIQKFGSTFSNKKVNGNQVCYHMLKS